MAKGVFNASVFMGRPLYPADITTTVSVYNAETDELVPTLWLERDGSQELANPHPLSEDGVILFYADPGRYNIVVEKGTQLYRDWPDVIISDAATSSGGAAAWGDITGTLSDQTDLQTALDGKLNIALGGRVESGTSYTLQASDRNQYIETTGAMVITIPTEASVDLGARFTVAGFHHNTTPLTFSISGVTLRFPAELSNSIPQYAGWQLVKSATAANTWNLKAYTVLA